MIGFSGPTCKILGIDNNGIHFPSETVLACSGVNGFWSIPDDWINECNFSWALKEISKPCLFK